MRLSQLLLFTTFAAPLAAQSSSIALLRWQRQNVNDVRSYDETRAQTSSWFDGMHRSITQNEKALSATPQLADGPPEYLRPEFWKDRQTERLELLVRNDSSATMFAEARRKGDPAATAGALQSRANFIASLLPVIDSAEARERRLSAAALAGGMTQLASVQRSTMNFYSRFGRILRDEHARIGRQVKSAQRAAETR